MTDYEMNNPFAPEAKVPAYSANYVGYKTNEAVDAAYNAGATAENATRGHTNDQYSTDPSSLMRDANSNIAKDGGRFGRINNKDYNTTLRLAREADRYNNMPMDHMYSQAHMSQGGMKDEGIGFDKPELKTMETRAMDQAYSLDTNQKQLLQSFQDAVNRKDYDAFKACYKQLYGIDLSNYEAEVKMREFRQQQEIAQLLAKDKYSYQTYLVRFLLGENFATVFNMTGSGKELAATGLGSVLGVQAPSSDDMNAEASKNKYLRDKGVVLGTTDPNLAQAYTDNARAMNAYNSTQGIKAIERAQDKAYNGSGDPNGSLKNNIKGIDKLRKDNGL